MDLSAEKRISDRAADQGQLESSALKSFRKAFDGLPSDQLTQFFDCFGNARHSVQSLDSNACQLWGR
jgi:hypothetical protein